MQNFTLKFGKYKGQNFLSTPASYQAWLLGQDWFYMPSNDVEAKYSEAAKNLVRSNYSDRSVDAMFEAEVLLDDAMYTAQKYSGMSHSQKQQAMANEYDEIVAENMVYEYYNS
jgi:hypothetical protein